MSTTANDADEDFAPPPPRSWLRRLRKFALVMLTVVGVIVLVAVVGRWQVGRMGQRQLEVTTARLDADEPDWRLDAILETRKKAEPPAAENSALMVLNLAERIPDDWRKWRNSEEAMGFPPQRADNHLPQQEAIDKARKHAADTHVVRTEAIRLRDKKTGQFSLTIADDPITTLLYRTSTSASRSWR